MSDWISVKDKVPDYLPNQDYSANVITTDGQSLYIMARCRDYESGDWLWGNCHDGLEGEPFIDDDYSWVTHWMPLPIPPAPQTEEGR